MRNLHFPTRAVEPSERFPNGIPEGMAEAAYEPHEQEEMLRLVRLAEGAPAGSREREEAINSMRVLHEFKALFPGAALAETAQAEREPERGHVQTSFIPPEGTVAFPIPQKAREKLGAVESLPDFDGETYIRALDHERLGHQLLRVGRIMADGRWHTLAEIAVTTGDPEASISARLRDLRKRKFGGHTVNRERLDGGLYRYRLVLASYEVPWGQEEVA